HAKHLLAVLHHHMPLEHVQHPGRPLPGQPLVVPLVERVPDAVHFVVQAAAGLLEPLSDVFHLVLPCTHSVRRRYPIPHIARSVGASASRCSARTSSCTACSMGAASATSMGNRFGFHSRASARQSSQCSAGFSFHQTRTAVTAPSPSRSWSTSSRHLQFVRQRVCPSRGTCGSLTGMALFHIIACVERAYSFARSMANCRLSPASARRSISAAKRFR